MCEREGNVAIPTTTDPTRQDDSQPSGAAYDSPTATTNAPVRADGPIIEKKGYPSGAANDSPTDTTNGLVRAKGQPRQRKEIGVTRCEL